MLRQSARCISNGAAICQVKVVVHPCSSTVLRCSRAALLLDNGGSSVVAFGSGKDNENEKNLQLMIFSFRLFFFRIDFEREKNKKTKENFEQFVKRHKKH